MEGSTHLKYVNSSSFANIPSVSSAPRVIGLYGVPGCGKSYLIKQLKHELGDSNFAYFEGSEVITSVTAGGLSVFKELDEGQKNEIRKLAIDKIKSECTQSGKIGLVTGHFAFWDNEDSKQPLRVCTQADFDTYTHILYVNTPVAVTAKQRKSDTERERPNASVQHLKRWQETEIRELRGLCRNNGILFAAIYPSITDKLASLIRDFQLHDERHNASIAVQYLEKAISMRYDKLQTVLFFDADKTLAADDTSARFWEKIQHSRGKEDPLKVLFKSPLQYSYTAFRQAMLMYEESATDEEFEAICEEVAVSTKLYPQISSLLQQTKSLHHIRPVIVTCGLRRVWEKVMAKEGLSEVVKIVGGGRLTDKLVVTPLVKGSLVTCACKTHEAYTWAFGDSSVDLPMMIAAHSAIVVVGEQQARSKSMDGKLLAAIMNDGLQARQALLPDGSVTPRLDHDRLSVVDLTEKSFVDSIFQPHKPYGGLRLYHDTDSNAAKLLMTPMRDANLHGPALRRAHQDTGAHLARTHLVNLIGTEKLTMCGAQGVDISGYQLLGEKRTVIVPMMRGGEPMAFGINDVFPEAQFVHAKEPEDIKKKHLEENINVILVDSVINNGTSVVNFVRHVLRNHASIRIFVVAGVVQEKAVSGCSLICAIARSTELTIIALRLSKNKYIGKGSSDTGNRLFNTTHLE